MSAERIKILDNVTLDSEADAEAAVTLNARQRVALANYNKCLLVIKTGTETGSADVTFDTLQASFDEGASWETVQGTLALQFTAAGVQTIAITGSFGMPDQLKLLVTATQLTGSHLFANTYAELHVGYSN